MTDTCESMTLSVEDFKKLADKELVKELLNLLNGKPHLVTVASLTTIIGVLIGEEVDNEEQLKDNITTIAMVAMAAGEFALTKKHGKIKH